MYTPAKKRMFILVKKRMKKRMHTLVKERMYTPIFTNAPAAGPVSRLTEIARHIG